MDDFAPGLDLKADLFYRRFAQLFTGHGAEPVSSDEHTAFLWYWLCYSLFCTRSQKMNRDFLPIAMALANGLKLALGPYFLVFLYHEILDAIKLAPLDDNHLVIGSGCGIL